MSNPVFQSATLATLPSGTTPETLTIGGAERQVVTIGDRAGAVDSIGSLTETAPGTDTASSGLNGRLQRVAQRLTSMIALLPTALGAGGGLKVDGSGTALPVSGTVATTDRALLNNTGTSNGLLVAPLALSGSGDLSNSFTSGAYKLLTGNSSSFWTQTNTGSAKKGYVYFKASTTFSPTTAGGGIAGWFVFSPDGGSTSVAQVATSSATVPAFAIPPDFFIPLDVAALGTTGLYRSQRLVTIPEYAFKVGVQNFCGATFSTDNANAISLALVADNN